MAIITYSTIPLMKTALLLLACALASFAQAPATPAAAAPSLMNPNSLRAKAPDLYRAQFTTTKGDFVVEVDRSWAPRGADRFYNLIVNGFFTDASFFRIVSGFIVQFGIPAKPSVAAVWQRANIADDPVKQTNRKGTVVFATAGKNTRTTQLFINLGNNYDLDMMGFAPIGKVVEGMDVVQKLYSGYGEGPDQQKIQIQGKDYLDKKYPKLDSIKSAMVITDPAQPPAGSPPPKE
jgi:peptidyl-prolyl cis-trans isomerase A (cyclophilin A)